MTINSVIMYGASIWSEAVNTSNKLQKQLLRVQRALAIRVVTGYRTISAVAALLLARIMPATIQASYFRRIYLRIRDLKITVDWTLSLTNFFRLSVASINQ